MSTCLASK
jgi:phage terminase large subunit